MNCFNPKREAHPLQTPCTPIAVVSHQSVSIPNGKPILVIQQPQRMDRPKGASVNPKREAHPLQTPHVGLVSRSLSVSGFNPKREAHPLQTKPPRKGKDHENLVSIPNGKPILFRRRKLAQARLVETGFQSQTGSPSSSDADLHPAAMDTARFQSQTGSPSSSDPSGDT